MHHGAALLRASLMPPAGPIVTEGAFGLGASPARVGQIILADLEQCEVPVLLHPQRNVHGGRIGFKTKRGFFELELRTDCKRACRY